jgi:hypothetical protein
MRLTHLAHAHGLLVAAAFGLVSTSAFAQTEATPAQPEATPAPTPMNTPEPGTTPAPAAAAPAAPSAPEATPADPAPAAAPEEPVAEETFPAAWFRIDSDGAGLQLWAGATHMITDTFGIASDIYVTSGALGEFDLGPSFVAGPVYITPMLGLQADFFNHRMAALVPQLYVTGGPDPIYMELWLQNYAYTVFDKSGSTDTGGGNSIYGRFFIDYKVGKYFAVGPEVEMTLALNSKSKNAAGDSLTSLPVGANIMLSNYGKSNNLFIFAGYETQDTDNDSHFAGRLTFVRNF